jgi:cell division protein FtsI (penicillin-binding protein 3)
VFGRDQGRARWIRVRMLVLMAAMTGAAVAVAHGAYDLGVNRGAELERLAREQYTRRITLSARRGMILDRHGEELAVEVEVDSVYADQRKITDPARTAGLLAAVLEQDEAGLVRKLGGDRHFVWLKRRVSPKTARQVRALEIPGVDLVKESKRFYPGRSLAAQVIGYAGIDSKGLEGIERKFDEQLMGNRDAAMGLRDASGRVIFAEGFFGAGGVVGGNVELTIDRTIQYIVEQELAATVRTYEARAGQVVVMDPGTGEILALASWPTFNPNTIGSSDDEMRRNRPVLDVFEPGSTFKVFTLAAVLDSGAVRADELTFCEQGRMELWDVAIHDDHRDGWLNTTQCLKRSSNICFAKMAQKLGKRRFYHYLRRFGFGERTHVNVPFEVRGSLAHYSKWFDVDTATIAFGQGVGTTGLQLTAALSAVANGGTLMEPQLVRRIVGADGETIGSFSPQARRRVVSRYTARLVTDMMTAVTEEGGTGIQAAMDGYLVAGKTGTAQKSMGSKGYEDGKWVTSFLGFLPSDKPRLAISVVIDEPRINHYGGTVAAPAFKRIADKTLRYLGVPSQIPRAHVPAKRRAEPPPVFERATFEPEPDEQPQVPRSLAEGQVRVPALLGMTIPQALVALDGAGLRPVLMGSGIAAEQIPPEGEPLAAGAFVQVNFQPLVEEARQGVTDGNGG